MLSSAERHVGGEETRDGDDTELCDDTDDTPMMAEVCEVQDGGEARGL